MDKIVPNGRFASTPTAAFRAKLRSSRGSRIARGLGTGGITGLGSVVYGLGKLATLLDDESLLQDAIHVASLFSDDIINADRKLGVLDGNAGAILALLSLYQLTGLREILARAMRCGDRLLEHKRVGLGGARSWPEHSVNNVALNGFSHGAAGFAYAMAALYAASRKEEYLGASEEALEFENSSFSETRRNWPDFSGADRPFWPVQWCHGGAGIGLSRLAIRRFGVIDDELLSRDVERAVEAVIHSWPGRVDTLCCGTLGCLEFLAEVGRVDARPEIRRVASEWLAAVVKSAHKRGDFRWNAGTRKFNLGLFRGLAGIGYTLLRHVEPSLPNILLLN